MDMYVSIPACISGTAFKKLFTAFIVIFVSVKTRVLD